VSRKDDILDAAQRIVATEGLDALSMRRLADEVGVKAPSLYKHVRGKDEVIAALQERALRDFTAALASAPPGVRELGAAYRSWALAHPAAYAVVTRVPLQRDLLTPGVEEAAAAPVLAVVGGHQERARALWAIAHGLVDLELADRFPKDADLDATWDVAVSAFAGEKA